MVRTLPWPPRRLPLCHLNLENRFPSCRTCVGLNLQPEPKPSNVSKSFSLHLVPYLAPAPRPLGAEGLAPHRTACPFLCPCPPDRAGPSGFPPWLPGPSRATDPNATTCRPFTRPWGPGGRPPLLLRWVGKQVLAPTASRLRGRGVLGRRPPSRGGPWLPSGFHCRPDGPRGCRGSCDSRPGVGPRVLCGIFLCHCRRHRKLRGCARHVCIRPRSCGPGVPHRGHWAKSRPRPAAFLPEPLGDRPTPDLPPPRAGLRALACGPCSILRARSVACEALLPQSRPPPTAAGKGACDCVHWNIPG